MGYDCDNQTNGQMAEEEETPVQCHRGEGTVSLRAGANGVGKSKFNDTKGKSFDPVSDFEPKEV